MSVPKMGIVEIPIAIQGDDAYLPIQDLFEILQLKHVEINTGVMGFIIHPDSTYQINYKDREIVYRDEIFPLKESDVIKSPTGNYLKSDYFGKVFGLHTNFSFRSLSVKFQTDKELPFIKEMKRKEIRENLNRVIGVVNPDTIMPRRYPFFKPGFIDWGVTSTQQTQIVNDNRFTLGVGTMFIGGETNLRLNYSTRVPFNSRNQFYQWRLVNNYSKFFKQVSVGRINTRATSSVFAPINGVQVSNSPFQNRRSFGTFTLSDFTEPRWTVELYVNNALVDFTVADASGFYTFEVPLMYGNTAVDLRFYGPYGEERIEERMINIPYNFVPKNEFEYTLSAGILENPENDRFSRLNMNYGLNNSITLGGGVEYLSDVSSGEVMPFVNASARVASGLLFSGEYMYGVKGEALLSYHTPQSLQVDVNYIKYHEDQTAIRFNYLEERKISLSTPIRTKAFYMFSRLSLNQILMPATKLTTAQLLLSGGFMGISTNLTTYGIFNSRVDDPTFYSSLSQTYRLPYKFIFSPRVQYDVSRNTFTNLNVELERPIFRNGFANVGYENNFRRDEHIFEFGLRYSFDMAQTSFSSRIGKHNSSFVESAQGSILFDDNTDFVMARNRTSVTRAALTLVPFLDLNWNGQKDPMEPGVPGLELGNRSGNVTYNKDGTVIRITELQPYVDLLLQLDPTSLDNIAWHIPDPKIGVHTTPNHFQEIHVPVQVLGEVGGMVYLKDSKGTRGQGRIRVQILNRDDSVAAEFLTEGDGYFTYLGLAPGHYRAVIDPEQLENLDFKVSPAEIPLNIEVDKYGDIVDTLEFVIEPNVPEEVSQNDSPQSPIKETEEPQVPKKAIRIDLGERGYWAFSDTDDNIKLIQQFLKELGYESGKIDGIYGEKTLQAVRKFQRETGIRLDGIFGPETLGTLEDRLSEKK
ncbi:peptidoglycan-binding protein [Salinimicrobium catena]|uniref:peptidoglycan-binding protein n=1 Tax=Salinimicrobium catena TaxID=390640 RepID=UPI002FE4CC50